MKNFNINNYVGVKLTDEGLKILESQHNELLAQLPPEVAKSVGDFKAPPVDDEGYSQIQLWALIQSFGSYMRHDNSALPFEPDIQVSEENLIDHIPKGYTR